MLNPGSTPARGSRAAVARDIERARNIRDVIRARAFDVVRWRRRGTIVLIQDRILHFVHLISFLQMKTSFLPQTTTEKAARPSSTIRFALASATPRVARVALA